MFCLAWQVKRRWCRRYCVERPLRASPFEVAYVHPSVLYRVAETKGTGRTELWVPSFPLSLSVFLACCRPFLSFSLSFFQHAARRYSAYIRFAGWIDACVHALSSQRDDWWENSISVVVIVPPSSALRPRIILADSSPSLPRRHHCLPAVTRQSRHCLRFCPRASSRDLSGWTVKSARARARARYQENFSITINLIN